MNSVLLASPCETAMSRPNMGGNMRGGGFHITVAGVSDCSLENDPRRSTNGQPPNGQPN